MEEPIFAFRNYIIRVTLYAMLFTICICVALSAGFSLLNIWLDGVIAGGSIDTNYLLHSIVNIVYFSIPPMVVSGYTGFTSSLLMCLLINQIVQDSNQDRLIYHFAAFAMIPLSFLLALSGWHIVLNLIFSNHIQFGWMVFLSFLTSIAILMSHNMTFPHLFKSPVRRKQKDM